MLANVSPMELNDLINQLLAIPNDSTDLSRVKTYIEQLKLTPQYPIILVGGTNGKGSVCAYLSNILCRGGYNVGTFTSPHVIKYNERICINNQPIDDATLTSVLQQIINLGNMQSSVGLSLFKAFTLAAHLIFIQKKIDIAIIEVGIGGLYDVTNLFTPTISAVTNVAMDHCALLGTTIEEIALQKSGIFRSGKDAFYGSSHPPRNILNYANQINCNLHLAGVDFGVNLHELSFDIWAFNKHYYTIPYPALRGNSQPHNAALAVAILARLDPKFPLSLGTIKTGILTTSLIGRFQVMPGLPQVILDVAHNPHSVTHMLQNMLKLPFTTQTIAVFGIAQDKDVDQIIHLCQNRFAKWYIAKINNDRGMESQDIAAILYKNNVAISDVICCTSIGNAYKEAYAYITNTDKNGKIICFGSFLVVEEIYQTIVNMGK